MSGWSGQAGSLIKIAEARRGLPSWSEELPSNLVAIRVCPSVAEEDFRRTGGVHGKIGRDPRNVRGGLGVARVVIGVDFRRALGVHPLNRCRLSDS